MKLHISDQRVEIPADVLKAQPSLCDLIRRGWSADIASRPTAKEMLCDLQQVATRMEDKTDVETKQASRRGRRRSISKFVE